MSSILCYVAPLDARLTIEPPKDLLQSVYEKLQATDQPSQLPVGVCEMVEEIVLQPFHSDDTKQTALSLDILVLLFLPTSNNDTQPQRSRKETQKRMQPFIDQLIRVWHEYPDPATQLLAQAVQSKCIDASSFNSQQVYDGILQHITRMQQQDPTAEYMTKTTIGHLLHLIKQVTKVVPPLVPGDSSCPLWDDTTVLTFVLSQTSTHPEDCARILWNGAITAPTLVAQDPLTWNYIRSSWQEEDTPSIMAAIIGNLVSGAPEYLLVPHYAWLTPFLCGQLLASEHLPPTPEHDATLRRIVRTLRCMGPATVVQYAPSIYLRALVSVMPHSGSAPSTRTMLVCQTLTPLVALAPLEQRRLHCPTLQLKLIDLMTMDDDDQNPDASPQTLAVTCECLLATITASPWTTSFSCFPNVLFQQLLSSRGDETLVTAAHALVSHLVQLPEADIHVCQSPAMLELISRRVRNKEAQETAIEQLTQIASPRTLPLLAADEHVLSALIHVCNAAIDVAASKAAAKQLIVRLIPEL